MSRKSTNPGYQSYYGRRKSGPGTALKWIIVFLLAVLVVSIGVYLWLENNLVYDDSGVYLPLPWKQQETSQPPATAPASPSPTESGDTARGGGDAADLAGRRRGGAGAAGRRQCRAGDHEE